MVSIVHMLSRVGMLVLAMNQALTNSSLRWLCVMKGKHNQPLRSSNRSRQATCREKAEVTGNSKREDLGVEGNSSQPISVALSAHDEVPFRQVPHLPGLVIAASHLHTSHSFNTS